MATQTKETSTDPRYHTANIRRMLNDVIEHARQDVNKVQDPRAPALFETTAKVLSGLDKAYADFEKKNKARGSEGVLKRTFQCRIRHMESAHAMYAAARRSRGRAKIN